MPEGHGQRARWHCRGGLGAGRTAPAKRFHVGGAFSRSPRGVDPASAIRHGGPRYIRSYFEAGPPSRRRAKAATSVASSQSPIATRTIPRTSTAPHWSPSEFRRSRVRRSGLFMPMGPHGALASSSESSSREEGGHGSTLLMRMKSFIEPRTVRLRVFPTATESIARISRSTTDCRTSSLMSMAASATRKRGSSVLASRAGTTTGRSVRSLTTRTTWSRGA